MGRCHRYLRIKNISVEYSDNTLQPPSGSVVHIAMGKLKLWEA